MGKCDVQTFGDGLTQTSQGFLCKRTVFFPDAEIPKLAALTSALGNYEDIDDLTEYALFRKSATIEKAKEAAKQGKRSRPLGFEWFVRVK